MADLRERFELARSVIAKHYPDQHAAPEGLMMTLIKAFGEAERRGYAECLTFFERTLSPAEPQELDILNSEYGVNRATFDDARLHQVIVGVIFKLGGPGLNERKRRACY